MRKIISLLVLASVVAVAGCNTVAGMGRDVRAAGQAVEDIGN